MKITGERVNLRQLEASDAKSIFKYAKDKQISLYTTLPHPYITKDAKAFIELTKKHSEKKSDFELGIELKETKEIIGMMSLMDIDYKNKSAEVGYWIGTPYWRQGFTREALCLLLKFGFAKLKLKRIWARVMDSNIASSRLLESVGFSYEGRARKAVYKNKTWLDQLRYSILNEEFRGLLN
ncbi:MAG: GNAT family protein [Candidatus Woesearchaeota archaeon]